MRKKYNKNFINLLIFSIIIRLFTFFIIFLPDLYYWVEMSSFLIRGINPYTSNVEFFYKYPPLFHYIINFFGIITNFTYIGPKLMIFYFDILNIILIYRIGLLIKDKIFATNISLFYSLNPVIILQFYHDINEFITLFFTLCSIFYLIKKKIILSSIFLGLGVSFKLYPIIFLISIIPFIYHNKSYNRLTSIILFLVFIFLTFIISSLFFLLISPNNFIECLFIHTSRMNLGSSLTDLMPELKYFYNTFFIFFGFKFSFLFIIQISLFIILFLLLLVFIENFNIYDLFIFTVIIITLIPLVNFQIQLKYTNLMAFPFLLFIIYKEDENFLKKDMIFLFLNNLILFLVFLFFYIIIFEPKNIFAIFPITNKSGFYYVFFLLTFIFFIINEYKHRKNRDYLIHLLNLMPVMLYIFIKNYLGVIFIILSIITIIIYLFFKYWFRFRKNNNS